MFNETNVSYNNTGVKGYKSSLHLQKNCIECVRKDTMKVTYVIFILNFSI